MGWYYGCNSRAAQIAELTADFGGGEHSRTRTLRKYCSGNTLWTVQETTAPDGAAHLWIGCYLLSRAGKHDWGYKPMDESAGPCQLTCPLVFLDTVPDPGGYATEWRARVRAWHAARKPILAARRERAKRLKQIRADALKGVWTP
jgi:hypothetical protein